jgi:ankyrin repeat protein
MLAAGRNDVSSAKLLIRARADLNINAENGLTALGCAVDNGKKEVAEILRRAGAG